jgi:hypothetical protein
MTNRVRAGDDIGSRRALGALILVRAGIGWTFGPQFTVFNYGLLTLVGGQPQAGSAPDQ